MDPASPPAPPETEVAPPLGRDGATGKQTTAGRPEENAKPVPAQVRTACWLAVSSWPDRGCGSYAIRSRRDGIESFVAEFLPAATHRRGEVLGLIRALRDAPAGSKVVIHSASRSLFAVVSELRVVPLAGGRNSDLWPLLNTVASGLKVHFKLHRDASTDLNLVLAGHAAQEVLRRGEANHKLEGAA